LDGLFGSLGKVKREEKKKTNIENIDKQKQTNKQKM